MKIRTCFVSNSSSSSFVAILPKNFKFMDLEITEEDVEQICEWNEKPAEEKIKNIKKEFTKLDAGQDYIMREGAFEAYDFLRQKDILKEYYIAEFEGGPDRDEIRFADREKVSKLLEL